MKKKIIAIALGLTLCLGMTRCTKGNIEPESSYFANKYIDLVTIYKDDYYNTEVLYDKNTKVMYFADREKLTQTLINFVEAGDTVLVKASHFMEFPKIVKALEEALEA